MHRRTVPLLLIVLLSAAALTAGDPPHTQQTTGKFKVYISVDMEGVTGTVTGDQLGPSGFEYARFREVMTREALAAIQAAKEAGATEILVSDSHGNGE
ncbi:MAG TPA: M55 family metallopeptidase, partial [Candidatus Acidoferrales bacterium]